MRKPIGALMFVGLFVAACGGDYDSDMGVEETSLPDENVTESAEAITVNAWNGTCAASLTLRWSPGGSYKCSYAMGPGTPVYAYYPTNGEWADVYVGAGSCQGLRGWVLKQYVSKSCL